LISQRILTNLFSAFTNSNATIGIREKCIELYHLCLRSVSWADGIEPEIVSSTLEDSFSIWMGLFM